MKHFSKIVPEKTQNKLKDSAELIESDFISDYSSDPLGMPQIEEISGAGYGGFEVTEFYSNGHSSGIYLTQKQGEFIDNLSLECWQEFLEQQPDLTAGTTYDEMTSDQQNELSDFEQEYFSEYKTLLRFESWADDFDTDEPKIFLRLSAGYGDEPYYRPYFDETIKEIELSEKDFLKRDNKELAELIFNQ